MALQTPVFGGAGRIRGDHGTGWRAALSRRKRLDLSQAVAPGWDYPETAYWALSRKLLLPEAQAGVAASARGMLRKISNNADPAQIQFFNTGYLSACL
jgi:hypothetical protein